jgi:hypothetical protein
MAHEEWWDEPTPPDFGLVGPFDYEWEAAARQARDNEARRYRMSHGEP